MKKLLLLLSFLSFLFSFNQVNATHLMGADMQWRCLGNDTFEITMVVYRRCTDGAAALTIYAPTITSDSCSNSYTINTGSLIDHIVDDITPVCSSQAKICPSAGGTGISTPTIPFGVERHILKYKIYLGGAYSNCCWYKMSWQQAARNSNITTGFADQDFLIISWLNRCATPCDNGPVFKYPPIAIRCTGQDVSFNNGVYDSDGDSLSYAMALPLGGGSYSSPWSFTYPLTCLGGNNPNPTANPPTGFNLDPVTGQMAFRPMQVQITVLKVMVTEWRKDSLGIYKVIGKTARDMQFAIVQNCTNKPPSLSGPFTYEACTGEQMCFTINTGDQDLTDTTRISWNSGIPGGTWTTTNGTVAHGAGQFCWTPTDAEAGTLPYYFNATVIDDHCPISGSTTRSYSITVKPTPKNIRTFTNKGCGSFEFKAVATSSSFNGASYKWYVPKLIGTGAPVVGYDINPITLYQFSQPGKYLIKNTMFLNGCTNTYYDTLNVDSGLSTDITTASNLKLCPGDTAILISDSATSYQWYDDTTAINGATSRIYYAKKAGNYSVKGVKTGCALKSNTITVTEIATVKIIKPASMCLGNTVTYRASGLPGATYQWFRSGTAISGATLDTFNATQDGLYYCIVSQPACIVHTITDTLTFLPLPVKPIIIQNNITLFSSVAFSYQWYFNNTAIPGATSVFYIATLTGTYKVKITNANGCSIFSDPYTFTVGININALNAKIKISPNPFHDQLSVEVKDFDKPVIVSLYDMQGRLILQQSVNTKGKAILNTSSLSSGVYLLEASDGINRATYKIEKQ